MRMTCAACDGLAKDCPECQGNGTINVGTCPLEFVDDDTWMLLDLAELFRKGLAPVPGGTLDQAHKFLQAARFAWAEDAHWKSDALSRDE